MSLQSNTPLPVAPSNIDERDLIAPVWRRPDSGEHLALPPPPPRREIADWRRLLVLAGGGLVCLILMNSLSQQARNKAIATEADLTAAFPNWEGSWAGTIQSTTAEGRTLAQSHVERFYSSVAPDKMTMTVRSANASGPPQVTYGFQLASGNSFSRVLGAPPTAETFTGRRDDAGSYTWVREEPEFVTVFREWIDADTFYVEGFTLQKGGGFVYHSGRLRRVALADVSLAPKPGQ